MSPLIGVFPDSLQGTALAALELEAEADPVLDACVDPDDPAFDDADCEPFVLESMEDPLIDGAVVDEPPKPPPPAPALDVSIAVVDWELVAPGAGVLDEDDAEPHATLMAQSAKTATLARAPGRGGATSSSFGDIIVSEQCLAACSSVSGVAIVRAAGLCSSAPAELFRRRRSPGDDVMLAQRIRD